MCLFKLSQEASCKFTIKRVTHRQPDITWTECSLPCVSDKTKLQCTDYKDTNWTKVLTVSLPYTFFPDTPPFAHSSTKRKKSTTLNLQNTIAKVDFSYLYKVQDLQTVRSDFCLLFKVEFKLSALQSSSSLQLPNTYWL